MNQSTILVILLLLGISSYGQTNTDVKYYETENLIKEVKLKKANFQLTLINLNDSIDKYELIQLKPMQKRWIKFLKNGNAFGEWQYFDKFGQIDKVFYGEFVPHDALLVDSLKNDPLINFKMPKFDPGYYKNFKYPVEAQRRGIQGKVEVQFTIDKDGNVGDISITKSVDEILDRYTYQFISKMPSWDPAYLENKATKVYMKMPLNFNLN